MILGISVWTKKLFGVGNDVFFLPFISYYQCENVKQEVMETHILIMEMKSTVVTFDSTL